MARSLACFPEPDLIWINPGRITGRHGSEFMVGIHGAKFEKLSLGDPDRFGSASQSAGLMETRVASLGRWILAFGAIWLLSS